MFKLFQENMGQKISIEKVQGNYRIISNGDRYRVQRRNWFRWWENCRTAGRYMSTGSYAEYGEYRNLSDADAALKDLANQELLQRRRRQHGWKTHHDDDRSS